MIKIEYLDVAEDVYDITVEENHNFYADGMLVHNCEIDLPTVPMGTVKTENLSIPASSLTDFMIKANTGPRKIDVKVFDKKWDNLTDISDEPTELVEIETTEDMSRIALCTLSATNWGVVKKPSDFKRICNLTVRALDALLDYQDYPVYAARMHTHEYRPLGVGIINFAYFLAKHGVKYSDGSALALVDEYAEAWSYYLIQASVELAKEKGACPLSINTKYHKGIVPIDTRKPEVDSLVPHVERMDWEVLRQDLRTYGMRNSTLTAIMPAECQHWKNPISLADGRTLDFHALLEDQGIDWFSIEQAGIPSRYSFDRPLLVNTRSGGKKAYEFYYNGMKPVFQIEFEDGATYSFTGNHQLLVRREDKEFWCKVADLLEDDDIVSV